MAETTQMTMNGELRKVHKRLLYPLNLVDSGGGPSTRNPPGGTGWRMDKTYIKVAGHSKHLYRVVDREGDAVEFLLTAEPDLRAVQQLYSLPF